MTRQRMLVDLGRGLERWMATPLHTDSCMWCYRCLVCADGQPCAGSTHGQHEWRLTMFDGFDHWLSFHRDAERMDPDPPCADLGEPRGTRGGEPCCQAMTEALAPCGDHPNPWTCPAVTVVRNHPGQLLLPIRDGGPMSGTAISFCPWCGIKL